MRKPFAYAAATVLVALSFGVAACGSSDSGDTSNEDALTKTELIAQADELCVQFDGEAATKINELFSGKPTQADVETFATDEIVPMYREQITDLRALNPSEEDAEAYNNVLDTLESELDALEEDPSLIGTDGGPFQGATAAAKEFGLKECGS